MRIRIKSPGGTAALSFTEDATVGDLLGQITEKTSRSFFEVRYGFPPKQLVLDEKSKLLRELDVKLDGESLTVVPKEDPSARTDATLDKQISNVSPSKRTTTSGATQSVSFAGSNKAQKPISLQKKTMAGEVPEIPLPERVLRVMPDDNSCLFRAFSTAALPTGDDQGMPEIRALIAGYIQADSEKYTKAVLEQLPDDYCRWIQTENAWGGYVEMDILAKHFDIQICSIDVQTLRVDRYNETAPTMCILVYSGIHYDTIVQSPSEPPHTKADNPPEFDLRIWESTDEDILTKALQLCGKLQKKHYYTDTGGMAIRCNECGQITYGEKQASGHAQQTGHYDMAEVTT